MKIIHVRRLKCERCPASNASRYRQDTYYAIEESNWVTLCSECADDNNEHWKMMWDEVKKK